MKPASRTGRLSTDTSMSDRPNHRYGQASLPSREPERLGAPEYQRPPSRPCIRQPTLALKSTGVECHRGCARVLRQYQIAHQSAAILAGLLTVDTLGISARSALDSCVPIRPPTRPCVRDRQCASPQLRESRPRPVQMRTRRFPNAAAPGTRLPACRIQRPSWRHHFAKFRRRSCPICARPRPGRLRLVRWPERAAAKPQDAPA